MFENSRDMFNKNIKRALTVYGCVFTTALVSLNIPEGVLFIDSVKRLKNDRCFHE